jgi:AcrR family transcriptional regulator
MAKRAYASAAREQAAAEKRLEMIESAANLLRSHSGLADFSLEAVGRLAGVTRLTVYNHFGSRRGLLEAVFADIARRGGIERLGEVRGCETVDAGIDRLVAIFCDFWASDPAMGIVYDAIASDQDVAEALRDRIQHGREVVETLVSRAMPDATPAGRKDAADLVLILSDFPTYRSLAARRGSKAISRLIRSACRSALGL